MPRDICLSDIYEARNAISGLTLRTPLVRSSLTVADSSPVWMKMESLQPTGAFKLRGAVNAVARLDKYGRARGVVCCSTGNHGSALAYAARELNINATICHSDLVPDIKVRAIEELGARVIRIGKSQDDAQREVDRLVIEEGVIDIPPFDHPDIIAGQGTIGLELIEERLELETILVPLSGGGLIAGIALAAKTLKPTIKIVGISMEQGAAMAASLKAGKPVEVMETPSLADSLGGGIGLNNSYTFQLCRDLVDEVILLTEEEIYRGMQSLFFDDRLVAEGASAVGHAALIAGRLRLDGPAAMIITSRNVDMAQFADVAAGNPVLLGDEMVKG